MDTRIAIHALSCSVDNVMRLLWHRDTCHVSRYTGHDYVISIAIAIRIAILRSRYNTRIVGPSIAMHRCIVTTLVLFVHYVCINITCDKFCYVS